MKLYIEIDPGSGYQFAGVATTDATQKRVDKLAQQLLGPLPRLAAPSKCTLKASKGVELCGVLDDFAVRALGLQLPGIDVQALVDLAKRTKWGGPRVRALVA